MKRLLISVLTGLMVLAAYPVYSCKFEIDRLSDSVNTIDKMVTQIFDIEERSYFNQNSSNNYYEANLYGCIPEPSGPSYFINVIYLPSKGPTNYPFKNNPLSSDAPRMLLLGAGLIAIARIGRKRVLK